MLEEDTESKIVSSLGLPGGLCDDVTARVEESNGHTQRRLMCFQVMISTINAQVLLLSPAKHSRITVQ